MIRFLIPLVVWVTSVIVAGSCDGQVVLINCRDMAIETPYVELLEKLEGESATREMFASQDVSLSRYQPRKAATKNSSSSESAEAIIDILGHSPEHGLMQFVTLIEAGETQTTIDVCLVRPAGMVLGQWYRYTVVPIGKHASRVHVKHLLIVELKLRRLRFINRIIETITRKRASEQIEALSDRMMDCVFRIGSRPKVDSRQAGPRRDTGLGKMPLRNAASGNAASGQAESDASKSRRSKEQFDGEHDLAVTIFGASQTGGAMRIALFNSEQQYRAHDARKPVDQQGEMFQTAVVSVTDKNQSTTTHIFKNVPDGSYAIAAFHDVDGNEKLNANLFGLPSESYGFSRNGRGVLGLPSYQDVEIQIGKQNRKQEFQIE